MLPIVTVPNTVLNAPTTPIKSITKNIHKLVSEMDITLRGQKDPEGVGLAAPQVGVSQSLFIIRLKKSDPLSIYINPKIIDKEEVVVKDEDKEDDEVKLEGCLSIPDIWAPLRRSGWVTVEYMNIEGEIVKETFKGLMATIVLHEIDHLNGVLFTQRCIEQGIQIYQEKKGKLHRINF